MEKMNKSANLLADIPFLTGAYLLALSVLIISSLVLVMYESNSEPGGLVTICIDMTFFLSGLVALAAMLAIAGIPAKFVAVALIPLTCFIVDLYFVLDPNCQASTDMLWRFDFWNFLSLALLCIIAFLRKRKSNADNLALAGWAIYIFGNVLLKSLGFDSKELPGVVPFLPLISALAFWIPSLWTGNRQFSSR